MSHPILYPLYRLGNREKGDRYGDLSARASKRIRTPSPDHLHLHHVDCFVSWSWHLIILCLVGPAGGAHYRCRKVTRWQCLAAKPRALGESIPFPHPFLQKVTPRDWVALPSSSGLPQQPLPPVQYLWKVQKQWLTSVTTSHRAGHSEGALSSDSGLSLHTLLLLFTHHNTHTFLGEQFTSEKNTHSLAHSTPPEWDSW